METLRQTIKTLFLLQDSDTIVDVFLGKGKERHLDTVVDENWFVRAYLDDISPIRTKDQVESIYQLLLSKWMVNDGCYNSVLFCPHKTVFNALLHFSACVLREIKQVPVCRYEHLLRWHDLTSMLGEDLLTTSYLASKDILQNIHRHFFCWREVIGHDNAALNNIFEKRMIDLHYHLYGSIFVFDMNWLSLMNDVRDRKESFKKVFEFLNAPHVISQKGKMNSLYNKVMKAAAIRLLLFWYLEPDSGREYFTKFFLDTKSMLAVNEDILIDSYKMRLAQKIDAARWQKGFEFKNARGRSFVIDYAITPDIIVSRPQDPEYLYSVLSGERYLLYRMFKLIFNGQVEEDMATLFYIYLVIKSEFRQEIVQLNDSIGFANFADYQGRKFLFLKDDSVYGDIAAQVAIGSSLTDKGKWLEARITPKNSKDELTLAVKNIEKSVEQGILTYANKDNLSGRYSIILHFIKREDDKLKHKGNHTLFCRHYGLRKNIKRQAEALKGWQKNMLDLHRNSRIVGIDAASSEIKCRPEVFGQAYRYLKRFVPSETYNPKGKELGFTFHVGEDFLDIVDGLRAVDESLIFLNLENRDRLGHALVLGTDIDKYYRKRGYHISLTKQALLDNVVWLYSQGCSCEGFNRIEMKLKNLYARYFADLYGMCEIMEDDVKLVPTMQDYYQSWLLRGDNPEYYQRPSKTLSTVDSFWNIYALNENEMACEARNNLKARYLYYFYHYSERVYIEGNKYDEIKLDEDFVFVIKQIQARMLKNIEDMHVAIETNPTSNYRIGDFERYDEHPILHFFNYGLEHEGLDSHYITVSINTDDKGVFSTSLEREFSVMAAALEKKAALEQDGNSPRRIYDWLDRIREMGFEMMFDK